MAKLMLVEDDNNLREIYEARLQAEGYVIVSARDGEEALVIAKAENPDLIISDVMMPKISGFEMLDILRNTDGLKDVKVIMLTALGQSDDQQRADRLGADRYMVKSQVTLEDIVKVAHELLQDTPAVSDSIPAPAEVAAPVEPPAAVPAAVVPEPAFTPPELVMPAPTPIEPPAPAESVAAAVAAVAPAEPSEPAIAPAVTTTEPVDAPLPAAPQPEPTDAATATSAAATATNDAQSTSQEAGTVETQIEDFVAGATPESTETYEPATSPTSSTEAAPAVETSPAPEPVPTSEAESETQVIKPITPVETPPTVEQPTTKAGSVPIANKKVIQPLANEPKSDIDTLLALEQAKEAATQLPPSPTATVGSDQAAATAVPLTVPAAAEPSTTPIGTAVTPVAEPLKPADNAAAGGEVKVDPSSIAL